MSIIVIKLFLFFLVYFGIALSPVVLGLIIGSALEKIFYE